MGSAMKTPFRPRWIATSSAAVLDQEGAVGYGQRVAVQQVNFSQCVVPASWIQMSPTAPSMSRVAWNRPQNGASSSSMFMFMLVADRPTSARPLLALSACSGKAGSMSTAFR